MDDNDYISLFGLPPTPTKLNKLRALASSTTFPGERANALAAIERIKEEEKRKREQETKAREKQWRREEKIRRAQDAGAKLTEVDAAIAKYQSAVAQLVVPPRGVTKAYVTALNDALRELRDAAWIVDW